MDHFLFHAGSGHNDSDDRVGGIGDSRAFLAGLAGLPPEEIRKAKILFIRNAISEYKGARRRKLAELAFPAIIGPSFFLLGGAFVSLHASEPQLIVMIPILIFWMAAIVQFFQMQSSLDSKKEQIRNALEVWGDDLGKEAFDLDFQGKLDEMN